MSSTVRTTCQGDQVINIQVRLTNAEYTSGSIVVQITTSTQVTASSSGSSEQVGRTLSYVVGIDVRLSNLQTTRSIMLNTSAIGECTSCSCLGEESVGRSLSQVIGIDLTEVNCQRQQVASIIVRCRNTCAAINQCSNTIINSLISEVEVGDAFCQSISVVVRDRTNLCLTVGDSTSDGQVTSNFKVSSRLEVSNRQSVLEGVVGKVGRVSTNLSVSIVRRNECRIVSKVRSCGVCDISKIRLVSSTSQVASYVTSDLSSDTQSSTNGGVVGDCKSSKSRSASDICITSGGVQGDLVSGRTILQDQSLRSTTQDNIILEE